MARMILSLADLALKEIPLAGARLSIGRGPRNDVRIDGPAVADEHAAIVATPAGAFLEDLGGAGGTRVNGAPVARHELRDGDVVDIGKYSFRYVAEAPAAPADAPPAAIRILDGANAGRELALIKTLTTLGRPGVQTAVIARRPPGYFITHVEGGSFPAVNGRTLDGRAHPLADRDVIEIAGVKMEFFLKA